jgi:hypothetical protein
MVLKKYLSFFCLFFFIIHSYSQTAPNTYLIKGSVKDILTGSPLPNAVIQIDFSKNLIYPTDEKGNFEIRLFYGEHVLQIRYVGYKTYGKKIFINQDLNLDVELENIANQLEEVVISGQSSQRTVETPSLGVNLLNLKSIQKLPAAGGEIDIIRSLQTLPGISSVGEGSNGINVRGGNVDQNLIYIDDMPIFNPTHVFGLFSVFAADAIREMQIYKGSIPARFAGRTSSVLDIKMTEPSTEKFKMNGGIGMVSNRLMVEVPVIKDKLSFLSAARVSYNDFWFKLLGSPQIADTKANFYDLANKVFYRPDAKNVFSFSNYISNDNYGIDSLFGIQNFIAEKSQVNYRHLNFSLRWSHYFTEKLSLNTTAVYGSYRTKAVVPDSANKVNLLSAIFYKNVKSEVLYMPSPKHRLSMGLSGIRYDLDPGRLNETITSAISQVILQKEHSYEFGIFASDEYEISKRLLVEVDLRYAKYLNTGPYQQPIYSASEPKSQVSIIDTINYGGGSIESQYGGFEPRLALRFSLTPKTSLKLGYNRMQQFIQLLSNNITPLPISRWKTSNQFIKPQQSNFFMIGLFHDFKESIWEMSLEGYYKQTQNILDYVSGADLVINPLIEAQLLKGEGKAYGAELMISKKKGTMTGWLSYTYARSLQQITGDFPSLQALNNGNWFPSNVDKPHTLNMLMNFQVGKHNGFSFTFAYNTGRPFTSPVGSYKSNGNFYVIYDSRNNSRVSDYHRLDFSWTITNPTLKQKRWEGSWIFTVYNLYGRKNAYSYFFRDGKPYKLSIFASPIVSLSYNFKFM